MLELLLHAGEPCCPTPGFKRPGLTEGNKRAKQARHHRLDPLEAARLIEARMCDPRLGEGVGVVWLWDPLGRLWVGQTRAH